MLSFSYINRRTLYLVKNMLRAGCFLLVVLAFAAIQIKGSCVIGKIKKAPATDESGEFIFELRVSIVRITVRFSRQQCYSKVLRISQKKLYTW